eukprot:jgi/Galph1/2178/GphlegSOOS_G836.1
MKNNQSETGSAFGYLTPVDGSIEAGVTQEGDSSGTAGNYQFASGEATIVVPSYSSNDYGINSINEGSEGSTGSLQLPTESPVTPYYPTNLFEPTFSTSSPPPPPKPAVW